MAKSNIARASDIAQPQQPRATQNPLDAQADIGARATKDGKPTIRLDAQQLETLRIFVDAACEATDGLDAVFDQMLMSASTDRGLGKARDALRARQQEMLDQLIVEIESHEERLASCKAVATGGAA